MPSLFLASSTLSSLIATAGCASPIFDLSGGFPSVPFMCLDFHAVDAAEADSIWLANMVALSGGTIEEDSWPTEGWGGG